MQLRHLIAVFVVLGCTKSETTQCGPFVCSKFQVCAPSGDHCIVPAQLDACEGKQASDGCSFPGTSDGVCDSTNVCVAIGCGNGLTETALGEVCDDGNRASLDGCSADCKSAERCGDGVADFARGESCDCGTDPANLPVGCVGVNSTDPGATCRTGCTLARCGDGVKDPHEFCDDGNVDPGDGCRADCTGRWTFMTSNTLADLRDVDALGKDDVWIVGRRIVLHWDGSQLTPVPLPTTYASDSVIGVHALAPNDVIIVTQSSTSAVLRYQAGTWTPIASAQASSYDWVGIGGHGSTFVILGAQVNSTNVVIGRWTGTGFAIDEPTLLKYGPMSVAVRSGVLHVSDASGDVWVYGTSWTKVAGVSANAVASSGSDLFTFVNAGDGHYSAPSSASFTTMPDSFQLTGVVDAGAAPELGFAVGYSGAVMLCDVSPLGCKGSATGTTARLNGISVVDKNHAFIVGDNGTILY